MNQLIAMSVFRRVAETLSFSETARELGLTQPTVSKHISALEAHLEVKLISRSTRQLKLTDNGQQYYVQCSQILDELSSAEATIRGQQTVPGGTLRVNMPVTFGEIGIMPHIWNFLEKYPEIKLDLVMVDHFIDLIKEGVDCTIRVGPLNDSSLISRKLGQFNRITVASPQYLQQQGEPESIDELQQHECIIFTLLTTGNDWQFDGPCGNESIRVNGRLSLNNPRMMKDAVLNHYGIAVVPEWLVEEEISNGTIKPILTNYIPKPMDIHILYPQRQYVPAKLRCFIDFLQKLMQ